MTSVQATADQVAVANKLNPEVNDQKDLEEEEDKILDEKVQTYLATRADCVKAAPTQAQLAAIAALPKASFNKAGCEKLIPHIYILTADSDEVDGNYKHEAGLPEEIDGMVMQFACEEKPDGIYVEEQTTKQVVFAVEGQQSISCAVGENWNQIVAYAYSKAHGLFRSEPIDLEDDASMEDVEDFEQLQELDEACSAKEQNSVDLPVKFTIAKTEDMIQLTAEGDNIESVWMRNQDGIFVGAVDGKQGEWEFETELSTAVKAFAYVKDKGTVAFEHTL